MRAQRRHVRDLLQESPSLRRLVPELMHEPYPDAVKDAVDETGVPAQHFPSSCPYAPDDVLGEDHLPEPSF